MQFITVQRSGTISDPREDAEPYEGISLKGGGSPTWGRLVLLAPQTDAPSS